MVRALHAAMAALLIIVGVVWTDFWLRTQSPFPIFKEEKLANPQRVRSWTADGFVFDGSQVPRLPVGMTRLPERSPLLEKLVSRGVEIGADGRMYGQIDLFLKCGNDPVMRDIRRVEIAQWLAYYWLGETTLKPHYTFEPREEYILNGGSASGVHVRWVNIAYGPKNHPRVEMRTMKPQSAGP